MYTVEGSACVWFTGCTASPILTPSLFPACLYALGYPGSLYVYLFHFGFNLPFLKPGGLKSGGRRFVGSFLIYFFFPKALVRTVLGSVALYWECHQCPHKDPTLLLLSGSGLVCRAWQQQAFKHASWAYLQFEGKNLPCLSLGKETHRGYCSNRDLICQQTQAAGQSVLQWGSVAHAWL